jgi:hypothetical protein
VEAALDVIERRHLEGHHLLAFGPRRLPPPMRPVRRSRRGISEGFRCRLTNSAIRSQSPAITGSIVNSPAARSPRNRTSAPVPRRVALDVLDRTIATGEAALTDGVDGAEVLARYMHAAVDIGLGALNIIDPLLDSADWPDRRAKAEGLLDRIVDRATLDGALAAGATSADIAFAVIRFCRPLAIGLPPADERAIAHRQIDTYLSGLAAHSPTVSSDGSG